MSFLNPLAEVTDYHTMLNRIFWFTTASAVIGTVLLRSFVPNIDAALAYLDVKIEVYGIKIPLGYVVPGLLIGLLARIVRLHDRISDILGIRRRFDVTFILEPLARAVGISQKDVSNVKSRRSELMGAAFYRYASSRNPQIDKHLICEALDWWSWYWVVVESGTVLSIVAIALFFAKAWWAGGLVLATCVAAFCVALPFFKHHCSRYADREVQEILSDSSRKDEVRKQMKSALSSKRVRN
jgi:hypothetical protein